MACDEDSTSQAEWFFWEKTMMKQAAQIANRTVNPEFYLDGTFPIAANWRQHFASSHDACAIIGKGAGPAKGAWGSGGGGGGGGGGAADTGKGKPPREQKVLKGKDAKAKGGGKVANKAQGIPGNAPTVYNDYKGKSLCQGFQNASCKSIWLAKAHMYDTLCPANNALRHHCNLCLSRDHGAAKCDGLGAPAPKKAKKGKGGKWEK